MARYTDSVLKWLDFFGVQYVEVNGWRTRGNSTFNPKGSVNHHTAGARRGVAPSLGTCINGRPDVPGPLCNILLDRNCVAHLIASGRANHAGRGGTRGMVGNSSCFGLEVEHTGVVATEPINWTQIDVAARIHAAWALAAEFDPDMTVQHWEWTTRKIDFVKGSVDPDGFRDLVAKYIAQGRKGTPPTVTPPEFVMDDEARKAFEALNRRLDAQDAKIQEAIASVWSDEATDVKHYGSLRGWLAAIADKLGVTRDEAIAHDPTNK